MTRGPNDEFLKKKIGVRLSELTSDLNMSVADLAARLGYSTDATLRQAIDGRIALGINKLYELGTKKFDPWGNVNLNWVVCGRGRAFSEETPTSTTEVSGEELTRRFEHLTQQARESLLDLLFLLERPHR
jgi:hypothetical protein